MTPFAGSPTIPLIVFIAYQMMFAQITPALITGAFANRVTFKAYLLFLVAWLLLVYFPVAHMVWGGGILQANGVLDFAGGIVVHATAGFAALAAVFYVGKRRVADTGLHSIPLVALGTGLLWFGWYGFNAGSELKVDSVTSLAFLNTDVAASFAAITWLTLAWIYERKPKFVGLLTGSIAGLAAVTPAAGYVSTATAILIGIVASVVCYYAIFLKNKMQWDDALDVWGVHGVGGVVGVLCLGAFAFKAVNPAGGANGLVHGDATFFMKEAGAVIGAAVYAFVFTYVMLAIINKVTPVMVTTADEELGLDESLHGEKAYL
jgi:Amt family ammonium transporter